MNADGTGLRRLPGTRGAWTFGPGGTTLAFSRSRRRDAKIDPIKIPPVRGGYSSTTTWLLDTATGRMRRLTPWRNGLSVEPGSLSPDGRTLALARRDRHRHGPEVLLRRLSGGATRVLTDLGEEPAFSPDGGKVAFVGYANAVKINAEENKGYVIGEVYWINVDGGGLRRLTHNKVIETSPAWDPSGTRLAYVEAIPDHSWLPGLANLFGTGNSIRQTNADGSCPRTVHSAARIALHVAWRLEADPIRTAIEC